MKIGPMGAELFHAHERTDRHDEVNSRFFFFFVFLRRRLKMYLKYNVPKILDKKGHGNITFDSRAVASVCNILVIFVCELTLCTTG
jgi:hypothetical protein